MRLSTSTNIDQVFADMDDYVRDAVQVAIPRALSKLADQAETAGLRKVNEIYRIGPRTFEQYVSVTPVRGAGTGFELSINTKGKGLPLYLFSPRQTKQGVTVSVKGRRFLIPHAFLARMKTGHIGVFARGAYGGRGAQRITGENFGKFVFGRSRLPINEFYTFSPPEAMSNAQVVDAMQARVDEQSGKVIAQEIRFTRIRSGL